MSKPGHIPRPCWNHCGVEIVHRMDGDALAWVETATGARHSCVSQSSPKRVTGHRHVREDRKVDRTGLIAEFSKTLPPNVQVVGNKVYMAQGVWFPMRIRVVGENYRPVAHKAGCAVAAWEDCACP